VPQIIWNNPYNTAEYQNQRDSILRKFQKAYYLKKLSLFISRFQKVAKYVVQENGIVFLLPINATPNAFIVQLNNKMTKHPQLRG
jgi:hypothetical protein